MGWVTFLGENQSRIYPNMYAKFGCGPTVVSKGGGGQTDRQTDTAALIHHLPMCLELLAPAPASTEGAVVERSPRR